MNTTMRRKIYRLINCVVALVLAALIFTIGSANVTYAWQSNSRETNEFSGVYVPELPEKLNVKVTKVWSPNTVGHPSSVQVQLKRDGEVEDTVMLTAMDGWIHEWEGLEPGYTWTVDEDPVPNNYSKVVTGNVKDGFVIENTYNPPAPKLINIKVSKVWASQPGQTVVVHPSEVQVQLKRNGVVEKTETLNGSKGWEHVWTDLDPDSEWTVEEISVSNYDSVVTGNAKDGFVIINTRRPPEPTFVDVRVTKVWLPASGTHPDSVQVQLYLNGTPYDSPVSLYEGNNWQKIWKGLPADGAWTVDEVSVPDGYVKTKSGSLQGGFVITNTRQPTPLEEEPEEEEPVPPVQPRPPVWPPDDPRWAYYDPNTPGGGISISPDPEDPTSSLYDGDTPWGGKRLNPDGSPRTGDNALPLPWMILLALSMIILRRVLFFGKKRGTE